MKYEAKAIISKHHYFKRQSALEAEKIAYLCERLLRYFSVSLNFKLSLIIHHAPPILSETTFHDEKHDYFIYFSMKTGVYSHDDISLAKPYSHQAFTTA